MLLQRLVTDEKVGFNYDYMGASEYEWGATSVGRTALAQLFLDKQFCAKKIQFIEVGGFARTHRQSFVDKLDKPIEPYDPKIGIEALIMGSQETLDRLCPDGVLNLRYTKEMFRLEDPTIVGWMNVWHGTGGRDGVPLMIVRTNLKNLQKHVEMFLERPLEVLREEAREKAEAE